MIFVTVGTHEQSFKRLIAGIDELVAAGAITEEVFIQLGYTTHQPDHCPYTDFLSYSEMDQKMRTADTIICHGGPATFMNALSLGKRTIVVPRLKKFNEHVNDHQLTFTKRVIDSGYDLEMVTDIKQLGSVLATSKGASRIPTSHNREFVNGLAAQMKILKLIP
ncbi:glycosyltransferase [Lactiplantibacillus sp. WILCCON 0030]|uniref:Glycosyltransferase n=1 Tax=Lactiplantibacillus brownii TaxID=3069269 RepID=A0ABU1ABL2_9LACO|nr:glycosyltransferase [Lactiplantibacillus brownii]MDQ7937715.1 glycosyltransferase [Lactiplantibacillus brownii]